MVVNITTSESNVNVRYNFSVSLHLTLAAQVSESVKNDTHALLRVLQSNVMNLLSPRVFRSFPSLGSVDYEVAITIRKMEPRSDMPFDSVETQRKLYRFDLKNSIEKFDRPMAALIWPS